MLREILLVLAGFAGLGILAVLFGFGGVADDIITRRGLMSELEEQLREAEKNVRELALQAGEERKQALLYRAQQYGNWADMARELGRKLYQALDLLSKGERADMAQGTKMWTAEELEELAANLADHIRSWSIGKVGRFLFDCEKSQFFAELAEDGAKMRAAAKELLAQCAEARAAEEKPEAPPQMIPLDKAKFYVMSAIGNAMGEGKFGKGEIAEENARELVAKVDSELDALAKSEAVTKAAEEKPGSEWVCPDCGCHDKAKGTFCCGYCGVQMVKRHLVDLEEVLAVIDNEMQWHNYQKPPRSALTALGWLERVVRDRFGGEG